MRRDDAVAERGLTIAKTRSASNLEDADDAKNADEAEDVNSGDFGEHDGQERDRDHDQVEDRPAFAER